jgi:Methionine aminopeptidase
MYAIGTINSSAKHLVKITYEAMWKGISTIKPGATTGDIGHAIQTYAEKHGFSIVKEYCGHGIGSKMHEPPQILHFGQKIREYGFKRV